MKRTLSLRSEILADLTTEELGAVAGGGLPSQPLSDCYYQLFSHHTFVDCITE